MCDVSIKWDVFSVCMAGLRLSQDCSSTAEGQAVREVLSAHAHYLYKHCIMSY